MPHLPFLFRLPSKLLRRRARRSRMLTLLLLLFLLLLLLYPLYAIYKPPHILIAYFRYKWPYVLWDVEVPLREGERKVVALSIDDAPSAYTEGILEVLRENEVGATFFIIGAQVRGRKEEGVLRDAVGAGMELGNHGLRDEPATSLGAHVLEEQILAVQSTIDAAYVAAGKPAPKSGERLFRPGSGFFSKGMAEMVGRLGYKLVLGSVYPHDAQIGWERVNARHILSMVRSGAIIVCHDRRSWTLPMLRRVLPELKRSGYDVVSIGELVRRGKKS